MAFEYTRADIDEYVKGKTWYWYVPVWLAGLYMFVQLIGFGFDKQLSFVVAVPYAVNFALHEFAHIFMTPFGEMISALAGSFSELLLGLILVGIAFKTRGYFASLFCFLWFMLACQSVGSYMSDARSQEMELVSLGGALSGSSEVIHDWNFIFGELGWLSADTFIGGAVKGLGIVVGIIGLMFAAWLLYKMAASHGQTSMTSTEKQLLHASIAETANNKQSMSKPKTAGGPVYPHATKGRLAEPAEAQAENHSAKQQ